MTKRQIISIKAGLLKYIFVLLITFVLAACSHSGQRNSPELQALLDSRNFFEKVTPDDFEYKARKHFIDGSALQQQYKYAEAILEYQQALKYDSSYTIVYPMAVCYKEMSKLEIALDLTLGILEKAPKFIPALELAAELYLYQMEFKNASVVYQEIVKLKPNKENQYTLARIYEYSEPDKSIEIYENLLNDFEDQSILNRIIYLNSEDTGRAKIETIERLYKKFPNNTNVGWTLIMHYIENKDSEKAFETLDTLEKSLTDEKLSTLMLLLGNSLLRLSVETAEPYTRRLVERMDERFYFNSSIQIIGGYLNERLGDTVKAEKMFLRSAKVSEATSENTMQAVYFYIRSKKRETALKLLSEASNQFPSDYKIPLYMGYVLLDMDSLTAAVQYAYETIRLDSMQLEPWALLGSLYDKLGKKDSVLYFYERALRIDPDDPLTNNNYAYYLSEQEGGNLKKAKLMSEKSLEAEPDNSAYLDTYGWIQYKLGNYELALEFILKSIDTGKASAEVFEHLGDIYIMLGRMDDALDAYNKSVELEPGRQSSIERIESIKKSKG